MRRFVCVFIIVQLLSFQVGHTIRRGAEQKQAQARRQTFLVDSHNFVEAQDNMSNMSNNRQVLERQAQSTDEAGSDGPRQCIFLSDPHVWVQHRHSCPEICRTTYAQRMNTPPTRPPRDCQAKSKAERLGCALPDFATAVKVYPADEFAFYAVAGREVHWVGSDYDQKKFDYFEEPSGGRCSWDYQMPDYCSRAIISELSTVYDGELRYPSLYPATYAVLRTMQERCGNYKNWISGADDWYASLLKTEQTPKACWNFGQDWRAMWCSKYSRCSCNHADGSCVSEDKIQCCRDMYQLFLDEKPQWKDKIPRGWIKKNVRTIFSIQVLKESHKSERSLLHKMVTANSTYRWLRLAVRTSSTKQPNIFLQYGQGPGFFNRVTFYLCKHNFRISVVDGNKLEIAQSGHKHQSYLFSIESDAQVKVGAAATNLSWTASYVKQRVDEASSVNCDDASQSSEY